MSRMGFLFLFCILAGVLQNRHKIERWLNPPPPRAPGTEQVLLYATSWCGYCAKTREFFADNGIRYVERDVEHDSRGEEEYQRLGGGGVPIVVVNSDHVIRGYDPDAILQALDAPD